VNQNSLIDACFTLQALTLKLNEEPWLHSSNEVAKKIFNGVVREIRHASHFLDNDAKIVGNNTERGGGESLLSC